MSSTQRRNPNVCIAGRIHQKQLCGMGMGSILMSKGGAGAGSSYPSVDSYMKTTGQNVNAGSGLGLGLGDIGEKLGKLIVKPLVRKPQNIKFNM